MTEVRKQKLIIFLVLIVVSTIWAGVAQSLYYLHMPLSHWVEWHHIGPIRSEVKAGTKIMMTTSTTIKKEVRLSFNDILYCKDPEIGEYARYSEQNTQRAAAHPQENRVTNWPYTPIPNYETICYINSNTTVHFPTNQIRVSHWDGLANKQFIKVVE
jgi:hypothetical protein